MEYYTQMGRLEKPSTPMSPPQSQGGEMTFFSGSSQVMNELTIYLQIGPIEVPNDDRLQPFFFGQVESK